MKSDQLPSSSDSGEDDDQNGEELGSDIWDVLVQRGLLGVRTRRAYQHVVCAWPSQVWFLATSAFMGFMTCQPADNYPRYYQVTVCRVLFVMMALVSFIGAILVHESARILQTEAFKNAVQTFPRSSFDFTTWRAFGVGPPVLEYVGNIFDCGSRSTLIYVVKALTWYAIFFLLMGLNSHMTGPLALAWVLSATCMGCLWEAWQFAMVMYEAVSMDCVCHVWEAVKDAPGREDGRDRFWLVVTDMHKALDQQLRDIWASAVFLYASFFSGLLMVALICMLLALCLTKSFLKGGTQTAHLILAKLAGAVLVVAVYAALCLVQKLSVLASITSKCMDKSVRSGSIYSAAVQKCGTCMLSMSEASASDHKDFLDYLDRNPTGVVMGATIDAAFESNVALSLASVFAAVFSYMATMVGLSIGD